jgi:hypothetical protein
MIINTINTITAITAILVVASPPSLHHSSLDTLPPPPLPLHTHTRC